MEWITNANEWLNNFLLSLGVLAPVISSLLIIIEGTLAFLPLFVFVTINILTLGSILGVVLSWICTVLGSLIAFYLFRKGLAKFFQRKIEHRKRAKKFMNAIDKIKFTQLVLIIAIPFIPSFFVNMGAGISHIQVKKYLYALLLGKIFVVIFWGYIGSSLLESITNPTKLIEIVILILIAYIIAVIVNKKFKLDKRF